MIEKLRNHLQYYFIRNFRVESLSYLRLVNWRQNFHRKKVGCSSLPLAPKIHSPKSESQTSGLRRIRRFDLYGNGQFKFKYPFKPSVSAAPNWRISAFAKRLRETQRSQNVVDSVKTSGVGFSIINWNICRTTRSPTIQKSIG